MKGPDELKVRRTEMSVENGRTKRIQGPEDRNNNGIPGGFRPYGAISIFVLVFYRHFIPTGLIDSRLTSLFSFLLIRRPHITMLQYLVLELLGIFNDIKKSLQVIDTFLYGFFIHPFNLPWHRKNVFFLLQEDF